MFPQVWKNSEFVRSYNLSFSFESPYGDVNSLFYYVYRPYLALLTLSLPVQTRKQSIYKRPFLVKIDMPGYFSIDCGVVTDMQVQRAVDEESWNKDGIVTKIKVNMTVAELYPALMLSFDHVRLDTNKALSDYLDAMAGIPYSRLGKAGSLGELASTYVNSGMLNIRALTTDAAITKVRSAVNRIADRGVFEFLRR